MNTAPRPASAPGSPSSLAPSDPQGRTRYSGKAIAALTCAVVGAVFVVPAVAALPLGYFALRDIRRSGVRGRWMANVALGAASVVMALWVLYALSFLFINTPYRSEYPVCGRPADTGCVAADFVSLRRSHDSPDSPSVGTWAFSGGNSLAMGVEHHAPLLR